MKRVVYCSQATFDLGPDQLMALLEAARRHNTRAGLSGMLLYCSQSFLQVLEGDSAALAATYARILVDDRHTNVRLLLDAQVAAPMFPDWTMGFEYLEAEDLAEELAGFTPATRYPLVNPDLITNAAVAQSVLGRYGQNRVR
ncbi:MAG TPA: BLUF domain-containing protein [Catenuloplanes sp.]|jgi:hypothetical protein